MLKIIFYFGLIFISPLSFAMDDTPSQSEPSNPYEIIHTTTISYDELGQINKIDQRSALRSGEKLSGIEHYFLKDEEFDKKREPFKEMLEKSVEPNRSPYSPPEDDTLIIPVIERGAIVRLIEENKNVQLETAGLYRCVGVAAWNTERIGCLHYDGYTLLPSLTKFIDDLTDHNRLNQGTYFLLVTNYLTIYLREMYTFLLENAPGSQIWVEAQHEFGGYVVNEQSLDKRTQGRFYRASEAKKYLMEKEEKLRNNLSGRSLSLKVDNKNISYGFSTSEMTENLEAYFLGIDSFDMGVMVNLPSLNEILQPRQLNISTEPPIFQTIIQKFYAHKGKQSGEHQELCYLYDSLTESLI